METPSDLTWEDVFAVCKVMGVHWRQSKWDEDDGSYIFYRAGWLGGMFTNPTDALEYLTAEEHPLEKKYGTILRTKP